MAYSNMFYVKLEFVDRYDLKKASLIEIGFKFFNIVKIEYYFHCL